MLAYLAHKNFQPRYLAGDGLYANADPATFHNPARDSGWRLILPVLDANLGIQTTVEGFHLIEGHWYCPSIPTILIDATRDFRAKTIDLDTYEARIAERASTGPDSGKTRAAVSNASAAPPPASRPPSCATSSLAPRPATGC